MRINRVIPYLAAIAGMAAVIVLFLPLHDLIKGKPGTVAFAEVLVVLLVATRWGTVPAIVASVVGALAWNFFFLPPYFSIKIADLSVEDGTLLIAFLITSITVGQLSARVKLRAVEAEAGRQQLERLYLGLQQETSERQRAEEKVREREGRIHRLMEANIIGVMFWNIDGTVSDANEAFLRIVGYTNEDLRAGKINWTTMTPPEYVGADARAVEELQQAGRCTPYEKEYIRADGERAAVLIGGAFLGGSQEQGVAFVLNITGQKRAEERIRYLAQHDALTGLLNRPLFRDRLSQAIAQARRTRQHVALLFLDLDGFKHVNDSLGHQVGDRLLLIVAQRLQSCLREVDSVARMGGDEFVIGLPAVDDDHAAMLIAQKVLVALRAPILVDQHELHVSGSIGISLFPNDGEDVGALMRAADTAMYHAKSKGRDNCQFFTPALNELAQRRLLIANRLHQALEREEFTLHYQPQVDLRSDRIVAVEALLRWQQSDIGQVPPQEFVGIAEENGLIVPLGEWVLRTACNQLRDWRKLGHQDLRMSVNLSPLQLRGPGFPERVASILKQAGLPATALELELTEGSLITQNLENIATLAQLADAGVRLAVDDFGTGYSSLSYLQRFPVDALKIDQSFVGGIGHNKSHTTIVSTIIAMARSLGLQVVAEGVETAEQAAFLVAQDCFAAQGFFFGEPGTAERTLDLLVAREFSQKTG